MKRLEPQQRHHLSDILTKLALMSAATLIFGQFVRELLPEQTIDLWVPVAGAVLTAILTFYSVKLRRPN